MSIIAKNRFSVLADMVRRGVFRDMKPDLAIFMREVNANLPAVLAHIEKLPFFDTEGCKVGQAANYGLETIDAREWCIISTARAESLIEAVKATNPPLKDHQMVVDATNDETKSAQPTASENPNPEPSSKKKFPIVWVGIGAFLLVCLIAFGSLFVARDRMTAAGIQNTATAFATQQTGTPTFPQTPTNAAGSIPSGGTLACNVVHSITYPGYSTAPKGLYDWLAEQFLGLNADQVARDRFKAAYVTQLTKTAEQSPDGQKKNPWFGTPDGQLDTGARDSYMAGGPATFQFLLPCP